MKVALTRSGNRSRAVRNGSLGLLLALVAVAAYLWSAPLRDERALSRASLEELLVRAKREPNNSRVFFHEGVRLRRLGQDGPARAAFERAATLDGDDEETWLAWADATASFSGAQDAFSILYAYLQRHSESARAHLALALIYQQKEAHPSAYKEALDAARRDPKLAEAWRTAGIEAMAVLRPQEAEPLLRKAAALAPTDARNQVALGNALLVLHQDDAAVARFRDAVRLAPDQSVSRLALGNALLARAKTPADFDEARASLKEAARLTPGMALPHLLAGRSFARQRRWHEARAFLTEAARRNPKNAETHFELARVCRALGDTAGWQRESRLHQHLQDYEGQKLDLGGQARAGNDQTARLKLARLLAKNEEYARAADTYRSLLRQNANNKAAQAELAALIKSRPEQTRDAAVFLLPVTEAAAAPALSQTALLRDADLILARKKFAEAARVYRNVLARYPKSARAYQGLGLALSQQGDADNAFRYLQRAVTLDPNLPGAQFALADLYLSVGFADEAIRRLEPLTKSAPENADTWHLLGLAYSQQQSRYTESEAAFARAAALIPDRARFVQDLALMQMRNSKLDAAEENFRRARRLDPNDVSSAFSLARFLLTRAPTPDHLREAGGLVKSVLARDPRHAGALHDQGRLLIRAGNPKAAVAFLQRAVAVAPSAPEPWFDLAAAYERLGNRERAAFARRASKNIRDFTTALSVAEDRARQNKRDPALRLDLARLYAQGGVFAKAINQYQMCLSLSPRNPAAIRGELAALTAHLKADGRMPEMTTFNGMVTASTQVSRAVPTGSAPAN